jgi:hypothetical protein
MLMVGSAHCCMAAISMNHLAGLGGPVKRLAKSYPVPQPGCSSNPTHSTGACGLDGRS